MRTPLAALVAAACLLAGIAGCGTRTAAGGASGPAGDPAASAPAPAGPGQALPGSAVPWAAVGPGWALVQASVSAVAGSASARDSEALFLIDPLGGRYTLFAWSKDPIPSGELFAWSGDKQRALFGHFPSGRQDNFGPTDELNLRTGKITRIPIDPSSLVVGYTRPRGGQLLVEAGLKPETGDGTFELIDLQGKVTRKLWSGYIYQPLFSSPDGKTYVVEDADGQALVSANGQVLRRIGHKDASCAPLRWWDAAAILAACVPLGPGDGNSQIWLIPASGKAPTAQTPLRTQGGASADWGDYDYVRLAGGEYVEAMGPHCGDHVIARLGPHGKATVIKVPGATDIKIEAATATRLLLLTQAGGCGTGVSSQSLVWLDPKTGAETPAVSAQKGQFGVLGVVPYYDAGPH